MARWSIAEAERADYCPRDSPFQKECIVGWWWNIEKQSYDRYEFNGMAEAIKKTRIPSGRIARCINCGTRWGGWLFDLA